MIDKKKLIQQIVSEIQKDLDVLVRSAIEAREAATHSESRQEGKYDTRGLEASYLAGGQARRAQELEMLIHSIKNLEPHEFSSDNEIRSTALVELNSNSQKSTLFLIPQGGGNLIKQSGATIKIIACDSPLGHALLGRKEGESFELELGGQLKEFEILRVT